MDGGHDLLDLYRGKMTWRRLWVLISSMPPESRTNTALREAMSEDELADAMDEKPVGFGRWSKDQYMMADVFDAIQYGNYLFRVANMKDGGKEKAPEPLRRPGLRKTGPRKRGTKDGRQLMAAIFANGGGIPREWLDAQSAPSPSP